MNNKLLGLAHIGVYVADAEKSKDFYLNTLRFDLKAENELPNGVKLIFCDAGTCQIELICPPAPMQRPEGVVSHIAIECENIEAWVEELRAKCVTGEITVEEFFKQYEALKPLGLEAINRPCKVDVYSDSQYVVKAFTDHWVDGWLRRGWKNASKNPVKNIDLWKRLLVAMKPHDVEYHWVRGHAGHVENERCDALATAAADSDDLLDDQMK